MAIRLRNIRWTPPILLHHPKGVVWRKVPQFIEIIHEYRASSYLEQTISASHRSWDSWKVFPNEVHQRAKSLLLVWSTGNSWERSQRVSSASCRAKLLEKSFSGAWSQDSSWYQKGSWSGGQVLRLVTATSLLMVRLIRAACWGFTECQSLVSIYWVLCIAGFP
jgi:hypothetical protein